MIFKFLNPVFNQIGMKSLILIFLILLILFLIVDYYTTQFFKNAFKTKSTVKTISSNDDSFVTYRKVIKRNLKDFKGSVFIFPPTGGENLVDRLYARDLALIGYEVFILQKWSGYEIEGFKYELHNVFYSSAQRALEKVQKITTSKNLSVLGTSVGALHASVALATNPNLKFGFIIVGGLPIPEVIISSNQPAMKDLKKERYKIYELRNDQQYLAELSLIFELEPTQQKINFASSKIVGAIVSKNDDLVPYKNQKIASDFFDANPLHVSKYGHTMTVVHTGLLNRNLVLDFFKEQLVFRK